MPLAGLVSIVPFTFSSFVGPAGADNAADCEAAFSAGTSSQLIYATDPPTRLAYSGQTVRLSGSWDPAAWDSLAAALACVRLDENTFDAALGTSQPAPANGGSFEHSFTIPAVAQGTRLCTRIRLTGDPAGEATAADWVSKMHCFEVDREEAEAPPSDDEDTTTPSTSAPVTTTTTAPAPAGSSEIGGETPATGSPQDSAPVTPEAPAGPPFDSAGSIPPPGGAAPIFPGPTSPEAIPLLPATGRDASLDLVQMGQSCFFTGLGLLALFGRRRRQTA